MPMGDYFSPTPPDTTALSAVSAVLQHGVHLTACSFTQVPTVRGGFYYLDPPYHKGYSNYTAQGFKEQDHEQLAVWCHKLHAEGALFLQSNAATPFIRALYKDFIVEEIYAARTISCDGTKRQKVKELLIRNYTNTF